MRVIIIAEENRVSIEGQSETVDLSTLDEDIYVVQWYGTFGEIEYFNAPGAKVKANKPIDDFSPFQKFVDAWTVEAKKLVTAILPGANAA
jgi:hypothetical protein